MPADGVSCRLALAAVGSDFAYRARRFDNAQHGPALEVPGLIRPPIQLEIRRAEGNFTVRAGRHRRERIGSRTPTTALFAKATDIHHPRNNRLSCCQTSLHWHGIVLTGAMEGVQPAQFSRNRAGGDVYLSFP